MLTLWHWPLTFVLKTGLPITSDTGHLQVSGPFRFRIRQHVRNRRARQMDAVQYVMCRRKSINNNRIESECYALIGLFFNVSVSANDFPFIHDINIDNPDLSCDTINYCLKLSTVISQTCCCRYHGYSAISLSILCCKSFVWLSTKLLHSIYVVPYVLQRLYMDRSGSGFIRHQTILLIYLQFV